MELSAKEILELLELASHIKKNPKQYARALQGKTLVMLFEKPSFRTRLSFHLAMESMGGKAIESVGTTRKAEEPKDSVRVLNGYCDYIMVRTHEDKHLEEMAAYSKVPIINGLSALYHPCQTLADLLSLKEHFGSLQDLRVSYVGVGNNVLHTLLLMGPKVGLTIAYCCPEGQGPDSAVLLTAQQEFGDRIVCYEQPEEAVHLAHAVYTDVWVSMGFEHKESPTEFQTFQVNEQLMSKARPDAVFMHCMPMERGKEVSVSLPDAACSLIFSQSDNRLHVQKALLINGV
jgi:ornithine carbamoyltransferase